MSSKIVVDPLGTAKAGEPLYSPYILARPCAKTSCVQGSSMPSAALIRPASAASRLLRSAARRVATGIPVTQYVPSPSQNRTRSVTPSGSQFESSTMVWGRDYVARAMMASNLSGLYQTAPT